MIVFSYAHTCIEHGNKYLKFAFHYPIYKKKIKNLQIKYKKNSKFIFNKI